MSNASIPTVVTLCGIVKLFNLSQPLNTPEYIIVTNGGKVSPPISFKLLSLENVDYPKSVNVEGRLIWVRDLQPLKAELSNLINPSGNLTFCTLLLQ